MRTCCSAMGVRRTLLACTMLALCASISWLQQAAAQTQKQATKTKSEQTLTITVKPGQNLRDIAKAYFNDPNLWREILRANNLKSAADIQPGTKLKIPATAVSRALSTLAAAKSKLDKASQAGARLFAEGDIAQAIRLHDQAVQDCQNNRWEACATQAQQSAKLSQRALDTSAAQRDVQAQATVADKKGRVENRPPDASSWADTELNAILIEGERLRTLSGAFAEVMFRDGSRLRLNANSQALIQRMRHNRLAKKHEAKVSLIRGDALTVLEGAKQRRKFDLNLANTNTKVKVRSSRFWVKREQTSTRFANYEGELEVSSGNSTVVLKKNQGSVVQDNKAPQAPTKLLGAPKLISPANNLELFATTVTIQWNPIPGARSYRLEISRSAKFDKLAILKENLRRPAHAVEKMADGTYHWRVAAQDKRGFPGPVSEARTFKVYHDETAPFIRVHHPPDHSVTSETPVVLKGETEPGATLTIDGITIATVPPTGQPTSSQTPSHAIPGAWQHPLPDLPEGVHTFRLQAVDRAGNSTQMQHHITYVPNTPVRITYATPASPSTPQTYVTPTTTLALSGRTSPRAQVYVRSEESPYLGHVRAGKSGDFLLNVPLAAPREQFAVNVTTATGRNAKDRIALQHDHRGPPVLPNHMPPKATNQEQVVLDGRALGAAQLTINSQPIELKEGRYSYTHTLSPGPNVITWLATDAVGNVSKLQRTVTLDRTAPTLLKQTITPSQAAGGEHIHIAVRAQDQSGLRKAARFQLTVGVFRHTGYLKLKRSDNTYRGLVKLPPYAKGAVTLHSVTLSDYQGNQKEYRLQ